MKCKHVPRYSLLLSTLWGLILMIGSCNKGGDAEGGIPPYDPNQSVKLTAFLPDSGGMSTQVILKGQNFGNDASQLRVYFNNKKAKVVRAAGDLAYVLAPRLPGDTCIISVVNGKDSVQYSKPFYYKALVQVSTISGTPHATAETKDGTLVEARFQQPWYIAVDKEKNILVGEWKARARLVNEDRNSVMTLLNTTTGGEMASGCTDLNGQTFYFPMNGAPYYYEFDPEKQWLARRINPSKKAGDDFDFSKKYSLAMSELDGMLYTITTNGDLVKINPKTREASLVKSGLLKDRVQGVLQVYLCFHPIDKHMLYLVNPSSMRPQDGPIPGTDMIYRINMRNLVLEDYAGTGIKGHADGPKDMAQFNNPCQINFDQDGNMYVGDTDNYCVRRISPEGVVSTIAGLPGMSGYLDGPPDVALFNRFWGMKIDIDGTLYIADYYNNCIRKLTIQ